MAGPWELFRQCFRVVRRGLAGTMTRESTMLWYDGKRESAPPEEETRPER